MKKFNKKYYISNCISRIIGFVFLIVIYTFSLLMDSETGEFKFESTVFITWIIVIAVYIVLLAIYEVLLYKKAGYSIDDDGIRCRRGVFFRKNSFLSYDKMHAINESQGLIQRCFGIEGLYIDSGSTNTAAQAEIAIFETKEEIKKILALIEVKKNKEDKADTKISLDEELREPVFCFARKEKAKFLLIKTLESLIFIAILFVICMLVIILVKQIENKYLGIAVGVAFGMVLFTALTFFLHSFVGQYDFKVYKTDKEIIVKHGLFVKINNKLPLERIKAVRTVSSLWDRIFGYARLYIDVVGFTNGNTQDGATPTAGILIPYAKKDEIANYVKKLVDGYDYQGNLSYKSRGLFPRFSVALFIYTVTMLLASLLVVLLFTTGFIAFKWFWVSLLVVIGIYILYLGSTIFFSYLEHRNEGIEIEDDRLILSSGGLNNSKMVVKRENVIAIEDITTYLRKKKNIYSYKIHIHTNAASNTVLVRIMDKDIKEKLFNFLIV